jgi:hypothetical protein
VAGLIGVIAQNDLTTASQLVADMDPGGTQNRACAAIFEAWFRKGPGEQGAALEWLASLPDEETRRSAFERVGQNWAQQNPEAVREFLTGPHGALATYSMISQVARSQAAKSPEAAMKWAATLPENHSANAHNVVLQNWLATRPADAADYVRAMPSGSERVQAVHTVSQNLVRRSLHQAADWYRTLPTADQQIARQAFEQSFRSPDQRKLLDEALKR